MNEKFILIQKISGKEQFKATAVSNMIMGNYEENPSSTSNQISL